MSYVIEVTDIAGNEVWYHGAGWYWTDQNFMLHGPYNSEKDAITDYAWHIHEMIELVNKYRAQGGRRIVVPR